MHSTSKLSFFHYHTNTHLINVVLTQLMAVNLFQRDIFSGTSGIEIKYFRLYISTLTTYMTAHVQGYYQKDQNQEIEMSIGFL